jgi:hypothetical protein
MKTLLNIGLSLLLILLSACGRQLVEFGDEDSVGGSAGIAGRSGGGRAGRGGNGGTSSAPTVTSTSPVDGDTSVPLGTSITASFSEPMAAGSITDASFTLLAGTTPVAGAVTYANGVATFTPGSDLADITAYTATLTTAATDLAGEALAADYAWSFTTGDLPGVTATSPANGGIDIPVNWAITATFSAMMDPATLSTSTFTVTAPGDVAVGGSVRYDVVGKVATFTPDDDLVASSLLEARITTGATDLAGRALAADYAWTFTTAGPPRVVSTVPDDAATEVANNAAITATFSEAMDAATITALTFKVTGPGTAPVLGAVLYDATTKVASFTPAADLLGATEFTATITTGAHDLAGNGLVTDYVWTFTSRDAPAVLATTPVDLATNVANGIVIDATFTEAMDTLSINAGTFLLTGPNATPVAGAVAYTVLGSHATFTPDDPLAPGVTFTAKITVGATDLLGTPLAAEVSWTFTTGTAPSVADNTPADNALDVSSHALITAEFSEAMDPASFITGFTVTGPTPTDIIAGQLAYDTNTDILTFTPNADLAANTTFTVTVTTDATDLSGTPLAADFAWSFTTGVPPDVSLTVPADNDVGVVTNVTLAATFTEAMDGTTIDDTTFTLTGPLLTDVITGAVNYDVLTRIATFDPQALLAENTTFTATITTGATDLAGNPLEDDFVWTFTTGGPPIVLRTNPDDGDINVALNKTVEATFSEAMDATTIDDTTFLLADGVNPVAGTVDYDLLTNIATFTPAANLDPNVVYTATITTGATSADLDPVQADFVWTFTTGTQVAQTVAQADVPLGAASNFVILASAGITNIPTSNITGDVGLTPDAASNITGFSLVGSTCPEITGELYVVDATGPACATIDPTLLTNAKAAALAAFNDANAAGRGSPAAISGDIGGLTLYPGLYLSGTTIEILAGETLFLDAQGDPNAVFIIRSANSITTEAGSDVVLTKGANAANVYWTAGSAITLGTTSIMKGTMIAGTATSLLTGATIEGRVLNQGPSAAAVSLDHAVMTLPTP